MLEFLTGYNEGSVLFLGEWGRAALYIFVALALGVLVLTWLDLREMRRVRAVSLIGLRASALALAVFMVMEPAIELKNVTRVKNRVVVLVDVSRSQSLPADDRRTRWERTVEALEALRPMLTSDHPDHTFEVVTMAEGIAPSDIDTLTHRSFVPIGNATHIMEALEALDATAGSSEFGGIVIISDGSDNGLLAGRVREGEALDAESQSTLRRIGAPIHTLATSEPGRIRDIAIRRVYHDDFAFVRNAVAVEVDIQVLGYTRGTIPVTLRREGEILQTRQLAIEAGRDRYRLQFEFVPELIGKEIYAVEIPVQDGEALAENNVEYFVVNVIRDKIRVLQVVGRPSWDVRFLRQLLKGNPNVDLISFFILRAADDVQRVPNREMSLIPFPTDQLFNEQLGSFDLIIFQNFTHEPYNMRQYLPRVRDYIYSGGGFVMVGGEQSFSMGGYAITELAEVLPVRIPPRHNPSALIDLEPFRAELTEAGGRHPITRLVFDRAENRRVWAGLPEAQGSNVVGAAAPDATVLATHPTLRIGDEPMPVIAVADRGDGRVMSIAIDDTWRWSFEEVAGGGSSRAYGSFWNSAIRWLIRDPELNLVQVEIPGGVYDPDDEVEVTVRVFLPDYRPAAGVEGTLRVTRRDLQRLGEDTGDVVLSTAFTTDDRGRHVLRYRPDEAGAYRVEASARVEDDVELRDDEIFLAVSASRELRDVEPRPDLLEAIAGASGGTSRVLPVGQRLRNLEFLPARVQQVDDRQVIDVWNSPYLLALLALLLGTEWSLRRRWGRM